jgi:hypothetical protein
VTTLTEFLEARLAEDQEAAEAAGRTPWTFKEVDWLDYGRWIIEDEEDETTVFRDVNGAYYAAVHAARHDPARVLREVSAKRAILEAHKVTVRKEDRLPFDPYTGEPTEEQYEVECEICGWVDTDPTTACLTLRHLAAAYSDHKDFREEWAA